MRKTLFDFITKHREESWTTRSGVFWTNFEVFEKRSSLCTRPLCVTIRMKAIENHFHVVMLLNCVTWFVSLVYLCHFINRYQYVRQGNQKLFHLGFPYRNIDISSFLTTKQFEEALITDKKKLSLVEPLTVEDRKFLQSIFSPVFDQSTVDLSKFDTEKIQGYAIVLKQIDGKISPSFC